EQWAGLAGAAINPLMREPITQSLDVGVRAINAMLPIGRGQRIGLFAGSGVGKSTLLGMMTRFTAADVIVVGLIGERGREVRDFVESTLGQEGLRRSVVVAAPADRPPLARLHGALRATAIAEYYRDQGLHVLLLMDSLTRFAHAQREIGLSVGEPPTTRGYPPSVFARLPALVERAGNGADGRGSITAFYTVLTEGDDQQEPIADAARAILDGHIVLSRRIADSGQYPAIDVEVSVSRVMQDITDAPWRERIRKLKRLMAAYSAQRDLIAIGAYQRGSDPLVDEALARWPAIQALLGQDVAEAADDESSRAALAALLDDAPAPTHGTTTEAGRRPSHRLDPLLRVMQQRQDAAARDVGERERALSEQEQRLEALRRYAAEYAAPPTDASISPALLVNRLAFRERLNAAVVQQAGIVDQSRQLSDVERARLLLASRETKVLEKLADSYRAQESKAAEQRVQRELDDLGGRRARLAAADRDPAP